MARRIAVFIVLICSVGLSKADYLEVRRSALIKQAPERHGAVIRKANPGEKFQLANPVQTEAYYQINLEHGDQQGWIYRNLVRRHSGSINISDTPSGNVGFDGVHCHNHLMYGIPSDSDKILCRHGYAIGYNYQTQTPDWVSYQLTLSSAHGTNVERLDNFRVDRDIPKEHRSSGRDYTNTGFDRGHLAPSAAIDFSREANDETFLYSNMTPQLPGFNRNMMGRTGTWGALEDKVRGWIRERNTLYVIAGTSFEGSVTTTGRKVGIPKHFFKIIFDPQRIQAIAFWMPQDEDTAHKMADYVRSIAFIEDKTGKDFLDLLTDTVENSVESKKVSLSEWES